MTGALTEEDIDAMHLWMPDDPRCLHCKERLSRHSDGAWCLFAPTQFVALTVEAYYEWLAVFGGGGWGNQ